MSTNKNISLFVPHVFPNFTQKYVAEAFADLGDVDHVDFVAKQDRDGKLYNAAYIHFKTWYDNYAAIKMRCKIETAGKAEFYHDKSEYYWIVLPNTAKKVVPGDRKPRLDLGEANAINVNTVEKPVNCPMKPTYAEIVNEKTVPTFSDAEIEECLELLRAPIEEWDIEASEEEVQMNEMEAEMEEEDANLVTIDGRYVQTIEQENAYLHGEVAQLRMALINLDMMYRAEAAKVMAISEMKSQAEY